MATSKIILGTLNLIIYGTHILHVLTLDIEAQFLSRLRPKGCHYCDGKSSRLNA